MILAKLINDEMEKKHLSYRAAAREAGTAHTTLIRVARGGPADVDTLLKLCAWLKINPSDVIDGMGDDQNALVKNLSALIERQPRLAAVFTNLLGEFLNGGMTQEEVLDVINYASYKMSMRRGNIANTEDDQVHAKSRPGVSGA
jgi:transcriptional regulator with XRE-family HTH domain